MKKIVYLAIAAATILGFSSLAYAQAFPAAPTFHYDTSGNITQVTANNAIKITGLTPGGCLQLTAQNIATTTGSPCGSGGGGGGTVTQVNTTYPILGGPFTTTGTISTAFSTTTANNFNALNTFTNSTSTLFTTGTLWNTGITSALALFNGSHQETAYTGTNPCSSNQALQSLSALGVGTCITMASSTILGDNNTFSGNDTFSNLITGSVSGNAGTATALQNARTINGVSFNGTDNIVVASTTLLGDNNTFSGTTNFTGATTTFSKGITAPCFSNDGTHCITGSGSGVVSITAGTGLTGGTITTSGTIALDLTAQNIWTGASTTFTGHLALNTASSSLFTATNAWFTDASTTAVSGTSFCLTTCITAFPTGTVTSVTLATPNSTLTLGGTNPVTTSGTINADLNLGHSNWWTALQNFTNATTSGFEATSTSVFFDGPAAGSLLATNANKQLVATGTIANTLLQTSGVSGSSCTNCNLTYTAQGIITVAANGSAGGGGFPFTPGTDWGTTTSATTTALQAPSFFASSTLASQFPYASTTALTTSILYDTNVTSALALFNANHLETPYGGSSNPCAANQAPTTLSAVGALGGCTSTFLTGNQTVTLSGDVTGSGATAITTAFNLGNAHWWTATQNFTNASSSEFEATSTVWLDNTKSALLLTDSNGKVGVYGGAAACTNQFVTALSALGASTCASVTDAAFSGQLSLSHGGTNASLSGANQLLYINSGNTAVTNSTLMSYLTSQGSLLVGTTTASYGSLTIGTSTAPQLLLSDNTAADNPWSFRDISNTLYVTPSTATGTTTPGTVLSLSSVSNQNNPIFQLVATNSADTLFQVDQYGHITASSTRATPTISSCGTGSPAMGANANDTVGSFTTGTSASSCTITFGSAYSATPIVVISDSNTSAVADVSSISTTAFTVSLASALSADTVYYIVIMP